MGRVVKAAKHIFSKIMPPSLLLVVLLTPHLAAAEPLTCVNVFSLQSSQATLLSDFQIKIDQAIANLSALRLDLDLATIQSPNSIEITALKNQYEKKLLSLIAYFEKHSIMTHEQLSARMIQEIRELQLKNDRNKSEESQRQKEQERKILISVLDGTKLIPHRIEPGSFKMGKIGNQIDVTLTKPFEMMATPTTQIVWKKVADLAEQKLPGKYKINPNPSETKGHTHPVEQVSYADVQLWIKALNELSAVGETALVDLIPGHKKGDTYRLPTEAEWEYVVRGQGQFNDNYHFGNHESLIGDYAWYITNSRSQIRPVAEKLPLTIDHKKFYDMLGNAWEWTQDWYQPNLLGGVDPQGPSQGEYRVLRGGSASSKASDMLSGERYHWWPNMRTQRLSFRLVRNLQ